MIVDLFKCEAINSVSTDFNYNANENEIIFITYDDELMNLDELNEFKNGYHE